MFNYFHQNKFSYNEKGQLTPIFIVVIVVLIIMAMVTVNLSKVSFIKTDSSNAADAGALAGGSVMANVFNAIAQANSEMWKAYWEFFATNSALFVTALTKYLIPGNIKLNVDIELAKYALELACPSPCVATKVAASAGATELIAKNLLMQLYVAVVWAIIINITAYSIGTYFHYLLIRDMAEQGRNSAVKMAHQFAFMNSGLSQQLKEGDIPTNITDADQRRNYRATYEEWFDGIGEAEEYTYSWKDGQDRNHSVRVKVTIDPVDTFKLKTTVLPWEAEVALLSLGTTVVIAFLYGAAVGVLAGACACKSCCNNPWTAAVCCPCWAALCAIGAGLLAAGIAANALAIYETLGVWAALLIAQAGIFPGPVITDDSGDVLWATICWIEEIMHDGHEHNRKVRVDTWQQHQGADLGLWQTSYPEVHSYSIVDFRGYGRVGPPPIEEDDLRHDPSIVATDIIGTP